DIVGFHVLAARVLKSKAGDRRVCGAGCRSGTAGAGEGERGWRAVDSWSERSEGVLEQTGGDRRDVHRWMVTFRRHGTDRCRWFRSDRGPEEGHDQPRGRERLLR